MNERVRKYFISAMALCCSLLLVFPFCVCGVYADTESLNDEPLGPADLTNIRDLLRPFPANGILDVTGYCSYQNKNYYRMRLSDQYDVSVSWQSTYDIWLLFYKDYGSSQYIPMFFSTGFSDDELSENNCAGLMMYLDYSNDGITWSVLATMTNSGGGAWNNAYKGTSLSGTPYYVPYRRISNTVTIKPIPNYPTIDLNSGQSYQTILQVLSYRLDSRPWGLWSSSGGGLHFPNGTSLTGDQRSTYEQVYIVMDVNHDNSITEEEVNYYNFTYNTNYDYSEVNEGDDFTELQFLEYIALLFSQGVENPGGGTGSGGNSQGGSGGITIGDNSFTQSQNQTIEENAVNVTVNNNNSLSQENVQTLENFIELNLGEQQENAFAEAVGGISRFIGVGQAFAGLVTAVLGFLPAWTITLLGVLFTIIFVMIVFRLLHVFL